MLQNQQENLKIHEENVVFQHVYKDFVTKSRKEIETSMGLAASQARLLTITARKSDCEFQSMRYSHQKIALSRDLANLSAEYQNSLDQTKLVYDFYGTGDETTPLSYGLMMTPSEMNGYLPILTTDAAGKVVLSSAYASAAAAAGIPKEGLGCLPSSEMRNKFLQGMVDSGLISQESANTYMGIMYSQDIGNGTTDLVTTEVQSMSLAELIEYYESGEAGAAILTYSGAYTTLGGENGANEVVLRSENGGENITSGDGSATITLSQLLTGDYQILCKVANEWKDSYDGRINEVASRIKDLDIWNQMFDMFADMLGVPGDVNVATAINYAKSKTEALLDSNKMAHNFWGKTKENKKDDDWVGVLDAMNAHSSNRNQGFVWDWFRADQGTYSTSDFIGITAYHNTKNAKNNRAHGVSISISNIARAYLTYFAECMQGLSDKVTSTKYYVDADHNDGRRVDQSNLVGLDDTSLTFDIVVDTGVNADQALVTGFYDAIFNQICLRGWTENNQVQDNDYLQEMLKTGKLFMATCSDDGYYYQGNYSTNTYVREVTDDEAITKAEAKYNTEKQKLNQKEEILDLKMKNLDTEISSLTTEYDTIKSVISKNIEKSFKRYDA